MDSVIAVPICPYRKKLMWCLSVLFITSVCSLTAGALTSCLNIIIHYKTVYLRLWNERSHSRGSSVRTQSVNVCNDFFFFFLDQCNSPQCHTVDCVCVFRLLSAVRAFRHPLPLFRDKQRHVDGTVCAPTLAD